MSSKRGRKRNDNLPPNRARDVQRAFRARRAAHLEALELRVAELEEENDTLRSALNLPPASRPLLGKGPTGKDKPKPYTPRSQSQTHDHAEPVASTSAISSSSSSSLTPALPPISRNHSPSSVSTRTHSLSPHNMAPPALHHSPQQQSASMDWEDMVLRKERAEQHQSSPVSAGYPISPVSTTQTHASYSYPPASSTSRQMTMAQVYMQPMPQSYPHSAHAADRQQQQQQQHQQQQQQQQQSDVYSDSFLDRRYSYSQPSYSSGGHDSSHMQHHHAQQQQHSPTTSVQQSTIPPHRGNTSLQQQQPISYAHRRSITEAQGYRPVVMNQPTPSLPQQQQQQQHVQQQHPHAVRIPTPSGMQRDVVAPMRAVYDIEPRVGRMS